MQKSIYLLEAALKEIKQTQLAKIIGTSSQAISNAKDRGSLTASMAWNIAEAGGEDPVFWSTLASAETERDSACKDKMLEGIRKMWSGRWESNPRYQLGKLKSYH